MNLRLIGLMFGCAVLAQGCGGDNVMTNGRSPDLTPAPPAGSTPTPAAPPAVPPAASTPTAGAMRWSDPATWGGQLPGASASVVIPAGREVLLDIDATVASVTINGTLRPVGDADVSLTTGSVSVTGAGSRLVAGSATQPHTRRFVITLTGARPTAPATSMSGKVLSVSGGGRLELFGEPRLAWTKLNAHAAAGASQLTLAQVPDWRPGDRLVVTSTDFDVNQTEVRSVASVDGTRITLTQPLTHARWGQLQTIEGVSVDERAEVGLLSRNIVIRGDAASTAERYGAHVMVMAGGVAQVSGVEFTNCGQRGVLGAYCYHWHLVGDGSNQFIEKSSVHGAHHKGIVVHGTNATRVSDNVIYDTQGHNVMFAEDGVEMNNVFSRNLAIKANPIRDAQALIPSDRMASNFWGQNPNNSFIGNVFAGSVGGQGIWFDLPGRATGLSAGSPIVPNRQPLGEFRGNSAHSHNLTDMHDGHMHEANGLFVQMDTAGRTVEFGDFTAFKNQGSAVWANNCCDGTLVFRNMKLANNNVGLFVEMGWQELRDSLVVGRSGNFKASEFVPERFKRINGVGQSAIVVYDNQAATENSTFVNFKTDALFPAGVFGSRFFLNGTPEFTSARNVRVVNGDVAAYWTGSGAAARWERPGVTLAEFSQDIRGPMVRDHDGSLTGAVGMVVPSPTFKPLMQTAAMQPLSTLVSRSAPGARYASLGIQYGFDCPTTCNKDLLLNTQVRRADGVSTTVSHKDFEGAFSSFGPHPGERLLGNTSYELQTPGAFPRRFVMWVGMETATDWLRITLPYAHPNMSMSNAVRVASVQAVDSATSSAYFHDVANGRLHVRLVGVVGSRYAGRATRVDVYPE